MVKGIIENTHIISSKVTKFIWLLGYNNFSKMDMYFETEGVVYWTELGSSPFTILFISFIWKDKHTKKSWKEYTIVNDGGTYLLK